MIELETAFDWFIFVGNVFNEHFCSKSGVLMKENEMKVLLVDDEESSAKYVEIFLREDGYDVDVALNGPDGLELILSGDYALAILDVMLPGIDGWTILEKARAADVDVPVLFLTALDQVEDRVKGLEMGADDYLVKPFSYEELLARVRAVIRRKKYSEGSVTELKVADLTLDLIRRQAVRGGETIDLTPKEFDLLHIFMRHKGDVLDRAQLSKKGWGIEFDPNTNVVDVAVRRLRSKIDDGCCRKLIHTIRGEGYVLENRG